MPLRCTSRVGQQRLFPKTWLKVERRSQELELLVLHSLTKVQACVYTQATRARKAVFSTSKPSMHFHLVSVSLSFFLTVYVDIYIYMYINILGPASNSKSTPLFRPAGLAIFHGVLEHLFMGFSTLVYGV